MFLLKKKKKKKEKKRNVAKIENRSHNIRWLPFDIVNEININLKGFPYDIATFKEKQKNSSSSFSSSYERIYIVCAQQEIHLFINWKLPVSMHRSIRAA